MERRFCAAISLVLLGGIPFEAGRVRSMPGVALLCRFTTLLLWLLKPPLEYAVRDVRLRIPLERPICRTACFS